MTSTIRTRVLFPLVAGALSLAACSSQAPQANAPATTTAAAQGAASANGDHDEHRGGVPFLGAALALDDLTPQQRTKLESIRTSLESQGGARKAAMAQLGDLFAKALDAGELDEAAASAQIDALASAVDAEKPAMAQAMNDLHATLTSTQRAEVLAKMRAHHRDHGGDHDGKHDEKGEGKDEKDEKEAKGGGEGMHEGGGLHLHMKQLADELALTDAQRAAYEHKLANGPKPLEGEHEAMRAQWKALADAFASDSFDAKALDVGKYGAPMARAFATRIERFVAASIEILDPGQRAKLAAKVRQRTAKLAQ